MAPSKAGVKIILLVRSTDRAVEVRITAAVGVASQSHVLPGWNTTMTTYDAV